MTTFSYTSGNPNNLVGGSAASMADIQGPFTDLRTFLNGSVSDINLASSAAINESKLATGSSGLAKGAFSAFLAANGTGSTAANIVCANEEYDVSGWYNAATGIFTPQVAGYYRVSAYLTLLNAVSGNFAELFLNKNAAVYRRLDKAFASATSHLGLAGSAPVVMNGTTDAIYISFTASASLQPAGAASGEWTYFTAELIGRP